MKPEQMQKISITGHRKHLQKTVDSLYRLKLLDVDSYDGELQTGNPFEEADELSELQVRTRSLLSKLPETENGAEGSFQLSGWEERLDEISSAVENLEDEVAELERELSNVKESRRFLRRLQGSGISVEDLDGTDTLDVFVGELDAEAFREEVETSRYEVYEGHSAAAVFYHREYGEEVSRALNAVDAEEISVPGLEVSGNVSNAVKELESRQKQINEEMRQKRSELQERAEKWRPELERAEEFLHEKIEKAEAPLEFATTERTFIAEGWIPADSYAELEEELKRATGGKVHVQPEETDEEPPTKYENNRVVEPFESLTDLVSTPRFNEIDPSALVFLTFPALFGFMIGDAGYGLTTGIVFYAGYRFVEGAQEIFKSLMWASFFTVLFGLAFGDAFGYVIFGSHSELAAVTGVQLFKQIPILFHRAEHLGQVFEIAAVMGFVHVNAGYLVGFYNEYTRHGLKEAFLEKISWIMLEIGAFAWYVYGFQVGAPVLLISVVMLYVGEGVEGLVEIPSLLSNILSYLRIFGVSVAAVALAAVVNAMAEPLFAMGGAAGLALGTLVLVVGHTFNTFIKIMEGFLQGIRLHYVEFFTKFFEGGGRRYAPFGART